MRDLQIGDDGSHNLVDEGFEGEDAPQAWANMDTGLDSAHSEIQIIVHAKLSACSPLN